MPLPLEGIGSRYGAMPKQELIHVRPQTVSPGPWCTSGGGAQDPGEFNLLASDERVNRPGLTCCWR